MDYDTNQSEMLLRDVREIRVLLREIRDGLTKPMLQVVTGVPEPRSELSAEMGRLFARLPKPPDPEPMFTLHQPCSTLDGTQHRVRSLDSLRLWLNRQKIIVGECIDHRGYEVYEPVNLGSGRTGRWLVGYLDRPFAPEPVTH